jgi:hypothetical protein
LNSYPAFAGFSATSKQPQGGAIWSKKVKTANEFKNEILIFKLLKPAKHLLAPH